MRGTHSVRIFNRRVDHRFEVRGNITVMQGDGGTGKTTPFAMRSDLTRQGAAGGVGPSCDKMCVALADIDRRNQLSQTRDPHRLRGRGRELHLEHGALFCDANDGYLLYYLTSPVCSLPYGVRDVHKMRAARITSWEAVRPEGARHLYGGVGDEMGRDYAAALVEDAQSGFEFFRHRLEGGGPRCETAGEDGGSLRVASCSPQRAGLCRCGWCRLWSGGE